MATGHGIHLVAGSFVERDGDELFNTSCLLGPDGALVAAYRKVHLFDVGVAGAASRESDTFSAGPGPVVAPLGEDGPSLGLTVCYDLRFPELYRIEALMGARIVTVPSAFTRATGEPHWELLLRARAVEDQIGVVAGAQWGTSPDGIDRHGHALVVDPWGRVLADAGPDGRRPGHRRPRPRPDRRRAGPAAEPGQPPAPRPTELARPPERLRPTSRRCGGRVLRSRDQAVGQRPNIDSHSCSVRGRNTKLTCRVSPIEAAGAAEYMWPGKRIESSGTLLSVWVSEW